MGNSSIQLAGMYAINDVLGLEGECGSVCCSWEGNPQLRRIRCLVLLFSL